MASRLWGDCELQSTTNTRFDFNTLGPLVRLTAALPDRAVPLRYDRLPGSPNGPLREPRRPVAVKALARLLRFGPARSATSMADKGLIRAQGSRPRESAPAQAGLALTPSTDQALRVAKRRGCVNMVGMRGVKTELCGKRYKATEETLPETLQVDLLTSERLWVADTGGSIGVREAIHYRWRQEYGRLTSDRRQRRRRDIVRL
jgi:hypothetical protein